MLCLCFLLGPSKESLSLLCRAFLQPLLACASPGWFPFLGVANITRLGCLRREASRAVSGCLSSSPIPLLLSGASLPRLRVTLTHFTILSYGWALRLPASFLVSDLARLGVRPGLCVSFWRAFASTRPLIPSSASPGGAIFACPLFPPWSLPSFTVGSALSSSCSRFGPPLSHLGAALPALALSSLVVLYSGLANLFLLLLVRAAPAYLQATFPMALGPLFRFRRVWCVRVFLLGPAPFCPLFAGLGSVGKHATSLLFSSCLTLVLFSPLCPLLRLSFYLELSGVSGRGCLLSPVLSGCNGSSDTRFSRGTMRLMSWPDWERYLRPLQFLVVSLLLSFVSTFLFSRAGGVLSHLNSSTRRFPRFPPRNLCSLVMLAVFSLVYAATDTAFC